MPIIQDWGDDLFTDGATAYGTNPNLYLGIEPWTTSPETTTGFLMRVENGELFDGYQRQVGVSSGVAGLASTTGIGDFASWVVERAVIQDAVSVAMTPSILVLGGVPDNDTFRQFGVCSHVSGGTLIQPGADPAFEYRTAVSGYFLFETKNAATGHRAIFARLNAGVITVFGTENVSDRDPVHAAGNAFDFFRPTRLRMTVDTSGATALVNCYRTTNAGPEVRLFGTQFNLSLPLAAGRCGFGAQTRRTSSSGCDNVGVASVFAIRSTDETTRYFVDRFERLQPRAAAARSDGTTTGHSLASRWSGDGKSRVSSLFEGSRYLVRGATANQVETGATQGTSIDWPGFYLRQDPPATREQHVATNIIRLNVDTGTRSESGLLVRLTPQAFLSGEIDMRARFTAGSNFYAGYYKEGYAVFVVHDSGSSPVWELQIRHYRGTTNSNYRGDLIATADLTSAGLAIGVAFELDVEIRNFDGDVFGQGSFVAIIAKVNTLTITPVAESINGIVETDDFLVDTRSAATSNIGGVGLFFNPNARGSADMCAFLDFTEKALTDPPRIDPDEQATVAVSAETAGVTGTLATSLEVQIGESSRSTPITHRFESGKVQTIRMQPQSRKLYDVAAVMENAEWQALTALLEANGNHTPFNWTHPYTDEALVVMFVNDRLDLNEAHTEDGRTVYSVAFQIERLFAQSTFNPQA